MCAQLVAGSFAFIGDHAPLRHADAVLQDRATGDRQPASMARWQVARARSGPRCAMRALRRELENLAGDAKGKGASGRAPMRAILPAPPLHGGGPRTNFGRQGAIGAPVSFFQRVDGARSFSPPRCTLSCRAAATGRHQNSETPGAGHPPGRPFLWLPPPCALSCRCRYRWRPSKQQRSYRRSGSGNECYPTTLKRNPVQVCRCRFVGRLSGSAGNPTIRAERGELLRLGRRK